ASEIFSLSEHHDREVAVMQQELQLRDEELEAVSREVLALRAEAMRTESTQLLRQFQVSQTSDRAMHFARVCFAPRALAPWAGRAQAHRTSRAPPREAQGRQARLLLAAGLGLAAGRTRELRLEDSVAVKKPETHRRHYEVLSLENGMRVVLASDPNCDKAACALCVGVGRLHEPKDMPGLAHFCEHMLFLGTEAFPEEAEYKRFIKRHGGKCNASTGDSSTCYVFDVAPGFLPGALDRFSQFFRCPLFTESATDREINAVDSEHSMRIADEGRRSYAALLLDANPKHPLHWGSGNAQSLRDEPQKRGVKLHSEVVKFYKENYTSEDMTLAVLGQEPLEELRRLVAERFLPVPRTGRSALRGEAHGAAEPPFRAEDFVGACWRVPTKDLRQLTFAWQLPKWQVPLWKSKPGHYASHVLGHEGSGSLLAHLKELGWATALSAGTEEFGCFSQFQVWMSLTEEGLKHIQEIGQRLFAYLALMRSVPVPDWVLEESQKLQEVKFRFAHDMQPYSLVSRLARNLQHYPPEEVLSAPVLLDAPNAQSAEEFLQHLTVQNLRLELVAKCFAERCAASDPWYGGQFQRGPLESAWRDAWAKAAAREAEGFRLTLPKPNVFVPEDLTLKKSEAPALPSQLPGEIRMFYRPDDRFLQPKSYIAFKFECPRTSESALNNLLSKLWCACIQEELNEFAYDASEAGLSYSLSATSTGIALKVAGFSDKLPTLLEAVVDKMQTAISARSFGLVRDRWERGLKNEALQRPCDLASRKSRELLYSFAFPPEEQLEALAGVKLEDVQAEQRKLFRGASLEALFTGNVDPETCRRLAQIPNHLAAKDPEAPKLRQEAQLPPGTSLWKLPVTNPEERNSCVCMELQLKPSLQQSIFTSLLVRMLNPKVFEELRTKQQLGYIVQLSWSEGEGFLKLRLLVQSEFPVEHVRSRMERCFKEHTRWILEDLDQAEFERQREGLASILAEAPKNLPEEFSRYWDELLRARYDFGRRGRKLKLLQAAELQTFRGFAAELHAMPRLYIEAPDRVWQGMEAARAFRSQAHWSGPDVPSGVHALGEQCHVAQESMPALSVEYIKHASGEFDEESVFQAILSNRSISKIEQLSKCCNLRWLDLSKNQIMRMENLEGLGQLVSVDLSFNKILKVGDLSGAPILERLMLKANPISKLQDLEGLKTARALRHLAFQNVDTSDACPVCSSPEYQRTVQQHCKDLVALDSKRFALPDLDREIRRLDEQTAIDVPDPEPWFTQADLDLGELPSPEELEETLKDPIQDFQVLENQAYSDK
ncbi:unnamed protein product, partial [Effrenium voratum]